MMNSYRYNKIRVDTTKFSQLEKTDTI